MAATLRLGLLALAGAWVVSCGASTPSLPHWHHGRLQKYELGPPSLLLSRSDESRLLSGRSVLQAIVADDGVTRRLIMVRDIAAPSSVCLLYTSPSPRDRTRSRMPSSA